jgi:hypothetical protein
LDRSRAWRRISPCDTSDSSPPDDAAVDGLNSLAMGRRPGGDAGAARAEKEP